MNKESGSSWFDYVTYGKAGARAARREQLLDEQADALSDPKYSDSKPIEHGFREATGVGMSTLASWLAGRTIGAVASKLMGKSFDGGSRIGGIAGLGAAGVANLVGAISAAITRRRTREEQLEHDKGSALPSMLIPGVGMYNSLKRQGRAFAINDERIKQLVEKKIKEKKKKKEKS